jgi:phosphate transport system substrate-binding protein
MSDMRKQSSTRYLLGTSSALVLSAATLIAAAQPANAQANKGIYLGGSTLASEAFRQIFDCYTGATVGNDGFTFSPNFPGVGLLPTGCTVVSTVQGMYAGVGSGNGIRGFVANDPAQWYGGTVTPNATSNIAIATPFPAGQPPFVDSANASNFGSYPYPRVDIGLSDSPLANAGTAANFTTVAFSFTPSTNWASGAVTTPQITLNSTTQVATYNTTAYGRPIQIPAFEINVAIPVNVNSTALQINSQIKSGGNIVQGGAIQLTEGQLCAIFSGLVTDWSSTATIPYLDNDPANPQKTAAFSYANVGNGVSVPQAYASSSLPITVVFRSDGSGTSFILTNYLKAVCPLLDPNDTFKYRTIFGASNLPNTSFSNLVSNIVAARGNGPWNATTGARWIGASGSGGVASAVGDASGQAGYIGYVSADFTRPYATTVLGTSANAPHAASLQNENLRISGVNVPNASASLTFIAPTPAAADAAWNDARLQQPATTWTYDDYNIYNNTFTTPTTQGGVQLSGQSVLPLTNVAGAYPLSGTTFLDLYSCYNIQSDSARVTNLRNFLTWYINGSPLVQSLVENNGFHLLPATYATNINQQYLTTGRPTSIQAASVIQLNGCTGVTGGAGGGAK